MNTLYTGMGREKLKKIVSPYQASFTLSLQSIQLLQPPNDVSCARESLQQCDESSKSFKNNPLHYRNQTKRIINPLSKQKDVMLEPDLDFHA